MDLGEIIARFELDVLSEDWIQSVWRDDFVIPPELPSDYEVQLEGTDFCQLMNDLSVACRNWVSSDLNSSFNSSDAGNSSKSTRKSWQTLIDSVNHKALICVISTFLPQDYRTLKDVDSIQHALAASRLYFMLLSIHGAHVYNIFNSSIYIFSLEALKIGNIIVGDKPQPKAKKKNNKNSDTNNSEEDTNESENNAVELSYYDRQGVLVQLSLVLDDLMFSLNTMHLKSDSHSLVQTIQVLTNLSRLERSNAALFSRPPTSGNTMYLAYKSYEILHFLCNPNHGEVPDVVRIIMINLFPALCVDELLNPNQKEMCVVKEHSVGFINKLLNILKEQAYSGVKALMQQLCIRVPDKADIRAKRVQWIVEILSTFPFELYQSFVIWVISFCHASNLKYRITGVELVTKLLSSDERSAGENDNSALSTSHRSSVGSSIFSNYELSGHKFLLAVIISRCCDVSPTVRAKALSSLSSQITSKNETLCELIEKMFISPYLHLEVIESVGNIEEFFDFKDYFSKISNENNEKVDPLPKGIAVVTMLEKLSLDEKVFVRKNALQALSNVCLLSSKWLSPRRVGILASSCKDASVSVRKMLVQCLTDLLLNFSAHSLLAKSWVQSVVPLIVDNEIKSQEKVLEVMESTILNNVVPHSRMSENLHFLPWRLLSYISKFGLRRVFRVACKQWTVNKSIRPNLIVALRTHIGSENNVPAWFFLVCLAESQKIPDPTFILQYFYDNIHNAQLINEYTSQLTMEALHLSWRNLPKSDQNELCTKLKESIEKFRVPLPLIARHIDICQMQDPGSVQPWARNLIIECETYLNKRIAPGCKPIVPDETLLCQYIFTLGELSQFCPNVVKKSTINLLSKLVDKDFDDEGEDPQRWEGTVSDTVCAITVTAIGKLCLQDTLLAKGLVSVFGNLLKNQSQPAVKINTIIALTDLCTRFTALVEPFLGDMCICLKDPNLEVRTNTLTLLMQLLQEDYLKMRCPFFFYILCMLEDKTGPIREQTEAFLLNTVLVKHPSIMCQQFLQALFFYNEYETPATGIALSPKVRATFSLVGEAKKETRHTIYRYMLDHMQDDHRFKTTYRLCTEVLDEVSEGKIPLNSVGTQVLKDALYILSCEEIRLLHLRVGKDEDDSGEVMEAVTYARKTIITQLVKKNYVENIVPIIIRLKHKLMEMKSPLVRDLMICLRELMKDFKEEIDEILAADAELAAEVALDLLHMEEEEDSREDKEPTPERVASLVKVARIQCERLSEQVLLDGGAVLNSEQLDKPLLSPLSSNHSPESSGEKDSGGKRSKGNRTPSTSQTSPPSNSPGSESNSESQHKSVTPKTRRGKGKTEKEKRCSK